MCKDAFVFVPPERLNEELLIRNKKTKLVSVLFIIYKCISPMMMMTCVSVTEC